MKRPYLLWKRGQLWYYRLAGGKTFHTTGQTARGKAEAYVVELLRSVEGHSRQRHLSFRLYTEPFFVWDRCPHIRRLQEEGKGITRRHARIQRQRLENHIPWRRRARGAAWLTASAAKRENAPKAGGSRKGPTAPTRG